LNSSYYTAKLINYYLSIAKLFHFGCYFISHRFFLPGY